MVALRLILVFCFYLLLPFIMAILCKRRNLIPNWLTYVITGVVTLLYPLLIIWVDRILTDRPVKCLNPEFALFAGNLIIMVPLCLAFQFIFNNILSKGKRNSLF